jgi:fluoride exporter
LKKCKCLRFFLSLSNYLAIHSKSVSLIRMKILLVIGTGSFIGGIFRYLLSQFILSKVHFPFPFGTLTVNIIGCLLIGFVFGLSERGNVSIGWQLFLMTGMLGGFTTFSAFSNETILLFRDGQFGYALAYIGSSVLIGLLATFTGTTLAKAF